MFSKGQKASIKSNLKDIMSSTNMLRSKGEYNRA